MYIMLINGDSLVELTKLPDNSVDLIVTDPPYGYSFMGKEWDKALPDKGIWVECLRVLKSGGFAYVMSAPRQDVLSRMMIDLEDSGFNIGFTSMYWAYATGFPKALNIGKAVDKRNGRVNIKNIELKNKLNELRNMKGISLTDLNKKCGFEASNYFRTDNHLLSIFPSPDKWDVIKTVLDCDDSLDSLFKEAKREVTSVAKNYSFVANTYGMNKTDSLYHNLYNKPASPEAKKLDGSYAGFQPKPAVEVIIVAMKPLDCKGYVDQALKNQKGISWFDDCRIPYESETDKDKMKRVGKYPDIRSGNYGNNQGNRDDLGIITSLPEKGRYPANLLVSDNAVDTGNITKSPSGTTKRNPRKAQVFTGDNCGFKAENQTESGKGDSGDFSRYFDIDKWYESQFIITPKASKSEKNKGCEDFEDKKGKGQWAIEDNGNSTAGMGNHNPLCLKCNCYRTAKMKGKKSCICDDPEWRKPKNLSTKNNHPTVKPLKLMSYLITLGSREGDVVLDPFMGSGTTPLASKQLNRKYIGIELNEEYFKICCARVENC